MSKRTEFKEKYGPWAIVAGASEGLGAAFANVVAEKGLNLILLARRKEKLAELAKDLIDRFSIQVEFLPLDLSDKKGLENYLAKEKREIGLLVYNAAFAPIAPFINLSKEQILKVTEVNIQAPLLMVNHFAQKMSVSHKGGILLMSSLSGFQGSPNISVYGASKAFNTIFAEALWRELKDSNVDVTACCAGAVRTPGYINAQSTKEAPGTLDASIVAKKAINYLGKGPVFIPGMQNRFFRFILSRIISIKAAVQIMYKNTKELS